jgi:signal transduction histidine kinase
MMMCARDPSPTFFLLPHGPYHTEALVSLLRLRWFIRLRWLFVLAALAALALERVLRPEAVLPRGLPAIILILALVNLMWMLVPHVLLRQMRAGEADQQAGARGAILFANAQVAVDLLLLTGIVRYTGGIESPLVLFYLFHMAICSLLLSPWNAMLQGVWALALCSALCVGELAGWISPHYTFLRSPETQSTLFADSMYAVSVLVIVSCGIVGTLYFTLHIAAWIRQREDQLRRANEALRQSQQAVQDLQVRRSQFMRTAAHQLKSPLTGIHTLAGLVRDGVVPAEGAAGTCERIIRRCTEAIEHVTELLTLARVQEADPQRHQEARADVNQIVMQECRRQSSVAERKQIELSCRVPQGSELAVQVDPTDLAHCVGNLIDNAIKYTTGPGSVTVTVEREKDFASVTVQDTGMGIDPATQQEMFDAYRRGNNALAAGISGSGLGLTIVREVVEQAGGRVTVRSRPGEGSTFSVRLPTTSRSGGGTPSGNSRSSDVATDAPRRVGGTEEIRRA